VDQLSQNKEKKQVPRRAVIANVQIHRHVERRVYRNNIKGSFHVSLCFSLPISSSSVSLLFVLLYDRYAGSVRKLNYVDGGFS
jgi:hypothetical protein